MDNKLDKSFDTEEEFKLRDELRKEFWSMEIDRIRYQNEYSNNITNLIMVDDYYRFLYVKIRQSTDVSPCVTQAIISFVLLTNQLSGYVCQYTKWNFKFTFTDDEVVTFIKTVINNQVLNVRGISRVLKEWPDLDEKIAEALVDILRACVSDGYGNKDFIKMR